MSSYAATRARAFNITTSLSVCVQIYVQSMVCVCPCMCACAQLDMCLCMCVCVPTPVVQLDVCVSVLQCRIQSQGSGNIPVRYKSGWHCFSVTIRTEGVSTMNYSRGMYGGTTGESVLKNCILVTKHFLDSVCTYYHSLELVHE